jgi:hypothetical protein
MHISEKFTAAKTHYMIAEIANYLEHNFKGRAFFFDNGGLLLDIKSHVLAWCREDRLFQRLEKNYWDIGGYIHERD